MWLPESWSADRVDAGSELSYATIVASQNQSVPSAVVLLSFKRNGVTVTETSIPPSPIGASFRFYAQSMNDFSSGKPGSIQTSVALVNTSPNPETITFEASLPDGPSTGLTGTL